MKYCPRCNQRYEDKDLNFCLNDGELLAEYETSDAPPTLYMDPPRQTKENWADHQTPEGGPPQTYQSAGQPIYQAPFTNPAFTAGSEKTLPIISLILGISSFVLMCCYPIPLSAAALIVGYIGLNKTKQDPDRYGGKEMAVIGMVLGGISLGLTILFIIAQIFASLPW